MNLHFCRFGTGGYVQRTAKGRLFIYEVKIEPNGETLMVEGKERYLEVDMRRIIEFFIYPIIRYLDEGLSVR